MARDIEAEVKVKDSTAPGLASAERRFRESGKRIEKDYGQFGERAGNKIISAIGTVAPRMAASLAASIGNAGNLGAPLLTAGILTALPAMSGLIGSAVTGGAAGAGIVGGVLLATRDSRVKEAGTQLGANLLGGLQDRAGSFVGPVLQSIDIIEAKFLESGDTIENIFESTSKQLPRLVEAIGNATQSTLEGIETAAGRSGPVMDSVSRNIEKTGRTVEQVFDSLSANGEANAAVLDATFDTLLGTVEAVGYALQGVTYVFGQFDKIMPLSIFTSMNMLFGENEEAATADAAAVQRQADVMQRGGLTVEQYEASIKATNRSLEENARLAEQAAAANRGLFGSATRVGEALDNAKRAAKENGETLSVNTKKGRENRSALDSLATSMNAFRQQQQEAGAATNVVSGTLSKQRAQFYAVALSMTGSTKTARQLTNTLLGIPSPKPKVTLNAAGAAQTAKNVRQEIASIQGKTVTVTVNVNASRLANVEKRLARLQNAGYGADGLTFAGTAPGQTSRTGGPAQVTAMVQNTISLDGVPFRSYTQKAIATRESERRFRDKVGRR